MGKGYVVYRYIGKNRYTVSSLFLVTTLIITHSVIFKNLLLQYGNFIPAIYRRTLSNRELWSCDLGSLGCK